MQTSNMEVNDKSKSNRGVTCDSTPTSKLNTTKQVGQTVTEADSLISTTNTIGSTVTVTQKPSQTNKKTKAELTKTLIKGSSIIPATGFIPSLNLFATKTLTTNATTTPGTFLNFTIANGELRQSTGPAVSIRDKRVDSSQQKPFIVTVSGLAGPSNAAGGTHQVQIACADGGDKNATVATTLSQTNAASILSALSSALPIGSSDKNIPIVVATAPPNLGKGSQGSARIISVPVMNAKTIIAATTNTAYKKIEPKPTPPIISTTLIQPQNSTSVTTQTTNSTSTNSQITTPAPSSTSPSSANTPVKKSEEDKAMTNGDKSDPNSTDYDPIEAMEWEDGIATLPGSNIKFKMNEFGTLELAMDESECKEINDMKSDSPVTNGEDDLSQTPPDSSQTPPKENSRKRKAGKIPPVFDGKSGNDIQNCHNCGGMGIREEFYQGTDFCSQECLLVCSRKMEMRKKRKERLLKKKKAEQQKLVNLIESECNPSSPCSSEDSVRLNSINDDSTQQAVSSTVSKATKLGKGFLWKEYLEETKAPAAPARLFQDFQNIPYVKNLFKVNMKLEGIDPKHPSLFCVLTVVEVVGFRMRLHFDGYSDCFDFWVNADSSDIFPAGWCDKTGHKLQPPKGHTSKSFNWNNYLKASKATSAPKNCFYRIPTTEFIPGFEVGMKLEAVDKKNSSLVCVATIMDVMANRFLVHFDGWDDMYDYWADPGSPYIHPINWCRDMGHVLTPPNNLLSDYKDSNNFNWEQYLVETHSTAVDPKYFRERPPHDFKFGMKIEVVDKRNPVLIRVATIVDTQAHMIKIHFDGWSEMYDYWIDDDSPDIHPPLWCHNARYPLQPPQNDALKIDQSGCPTPGCMGIGHIKGPKYTSHHSAFGCPYSPPNLSKENAMGDRLGTGRSGEAVFIEPLVKKSEAAANAIQQQETKHSPEGPARFRRCPTPGCNGMGHVTGKFTVHHRVSGCPLAVKNSQKEKECNQLNAVESPIPPQINIKTENKVNLVLPPPMQLNNHYNNSKRGRKKFKAITNQVGNKNGQNVMARQKFTKLKSTIHKLPKAIKPKEENKIGVDVVQDKVHHSVFTSTSIFHPILPTEEISVCWNQHSLLLPGITQMPGFNVTKWNAHEVASFITGLTGSLNIGKIFSDEQIDGEALMLLTQNDLTKMMSLKLGPALKIFNSIVMFRKRLENI